MNYPDQTAEVGNLNMSFSECVQTKQKMKKTELLKVLPVTFLCNLFWRFGTKFLKALEKLKNKIDKIVDKKTEKKFRYASLEL